MADESPQDIKISPPAGLRSELGTVGLQMAGGVVQEETHSALQWPACLDTYHKMGYDPAIASADNTIKAFIRRAEYSVGFEEKVEGGDEQITFVKSLMDDMEGSFTDTILEMASIIMWGFSVHEKVFKYRNQKGKYKSRYDDGKVGWAKLPIRSQRSIEKWAFDSKGRELLYVTQNLNLFMSNYDIDGVTGKKDFKDSEIKIPRGRFMHIRHNPVRNNPEGTSPLRSCYIPWMYKAKIEEYQAIGISRDLGGMPVITMPPEYMSPDAPEDKKAFYQHCIDIINNLSNNKQAGLIFPKHVDDAGNDLFTFKLESVNGGKLYDTSSIINGYENKILMTFLADVLKLGQDASGSFALSDNKTNLLAIGIQSIIEEILQEFNNDLIPETMRMNGFQPIDGYYPKIMLEDLEDTDLEKLGKFIQQTVSVGALEVDEGLSDALRIKAKLPPANRDKPIKEEMIGGGISKSGEGMKTAGEGTATTPAGGDKATANASKS